MRIGPRGRLGWCRTGQGNRLVDSNGDYQSRATQRFKEFHGTEVPNNITRSSTQLYSCYSLVVPVSRYGTREHGKTESTRYRYVLPNISLVELHVVEMKADTANPSKFKLGVEVLSDPAHALYLDWLHNLTGEDSWA
jgi:hypothetical protein